MTVVAAEQLKSQLQVARANDDKGNEDDSQTEAV